MYKIFFSGIYIYKARKNTINFFMEQRITDRENAVNNQFGYMDIRTGQFIQRDLKKMLIDLGIYTEPTEQREMSEDLKAYYSKLQQIVNSL